MRETRGNANHARVEKKKSGSADGEPLNEKAPKATILIAFRRDSATSWYIGTVATEGVQ